MCGRAIFLLTMKIRDTGRLLLPHAPAIRSPTGCRAGLLLLGLGCDTQRFPYLTARVLPMPVFGLLLATVLCNHVVFSAAIYLRAHNREPFLPVSIAIGVLTACGTLLMGKSCQTRRRDARLFLHLRNLWFRLRTFIFMTKRRQWHKSSAIEEVITP